MNAVFGHSVFRSPLCVFVLSCQSQKMDEQSSKTNLLKWLAKLRQKFYKDQAKKSKKKSTEIEYHKFSYKIGHISRNKR